MLYSSARWHRRFDGTPVADRRPATDDRHHSAQVTFVSLVVLTGCQPHRLLSASTSASPRPPSVSGSRVSRTGGRGLASATARRRQCQSDPSHTSTGAAASGRSADAATLLVTSSETTTLASGLSA